MTMSDGIELEYAVVTPPEFDAAETYPVMLALPPGAQDHDTVEGTVMSIYAIEAQARGWIVLSPVAPGGQTFFGGAEDYIPELLDRTADAYTPDGSYHLVGVSNGGLSAFRVAGQHPDRFRSLLVFPGFPRTDEDRDRLEVVATLPIAMFVGQDDPGWVGPMRDAVAELTALGADVTLEVVPGEGHIISSLSDGVRIFDTLESLG